MKLHVHEWGAPGATPLACLHGVTSHGGRFQQLGEHLGARFHVVAPDLRGHGYSDWEPPWDVEAHLADVLDTVPDETRLWLGHSFGGRLVAELAARRPELVERVVLLDPALQILPHVANDLAEQERQEASFATVEEAVAVRYDLGRVLLAPRELVVEADSVHMEPGRDGRLRYRYSKTAVIAAWSEMATSAPEPARVPTLIVLGERSWLFLDEQIETYRAALGDLVQVVTVPGGHTVYWDALAETTAAIDAFLR